MDEELSKRLNMRATESWMDMVRAASRAEGLRVGDFIRRAVLMYVREHHPALVRDE